MADYVLVPVEAGKTYGIRVERDGREIGAYFLFALPEERYTAFTQECMDLTTDDTVDAFFGCQWHLDNTGQSGGGSGEDINVVEVWEGGNTGAGVNIAIVDDGLYLEHEDLKNRVNTSRNYDYWTGVPGGVSQLFWVNHGTSVAGLIAAEHNEVGVRGVAPGATIYSYNFVDWLSAGEAELRDLVDAMTRHRVGTQVSSNSWGFLDDGAPHPAEAAWEAAIETGLREGDGGRGISYIWAAGNGGDPDDYALDNANLDGYLNFYGVTAVCAVDHSGKKSRYSEPGANLWVCAPSDGDGAFITTTKSAALLYPFGDGSDFTPGLYWGDFGGTSAAAPIVSGVVALIKSANPLLTWRDVKLILAASARKNDASDGDWEDGALQYGSDTDDYSFNHKYGFGVVDAGAAVDLAADWTNVPDQRTHEVEWTGPTRFSTVINTPYTRTVTVSQSSIDFIEFVEVTAEIDHDSFCDLKIELESPTGATSLLTHSGEVYDDYGRPVSWDGAFRFGSAKHLGESPVGAWKLHITDEFADNGGTFRGFRIKFYGFSGKPGAPAAPSGTSDADSLLVTWSAPSNTGSSAITSYDLRYIRGDAADKASEHWTEVTDAQTSGANSHDLTGLTLGVRYDIQVRANNDAGAGPWSPTYVGSVPVAPGTPTNMAATARTSGLVITWEPPASDGGADIVRYDIRSSVADADSWTGWQTAWRSGDGDLRASVTGLANHTRYDVQVRAANRAGAGDAATITAEPEPANLGPLFPASETGVREIGEHAVSPAAVGAPVLAIDPDDDQLYYSVPPTAPFVIDELTGQLRVRASLNLDYETRDTYTVQVSVSDRKNAEGGSNDEVDDRITVTVNVLNENDAPTINGPREVSVLENSEGIVAEYVGMDIEDDPLTYTLLGSDKDAFTLGGPEDEMQDSGIADGALEFKTPPDYDEPGDVGKDNKYNVTVRVADAARHTDHAVVVTVQDVDEPPLVTGPTDVDFPEDGLGAVATYQASDPEEPTRAITFDIGGDDAALFTIHEDSGELRFKQRPNYEDSGDANDDDVYEVEILASDSFLVGKLDVLIRPTDVDEAPEISGPAHVTIEENATDFVGTYTRADPEGQPASWKPLSGPDALDFAFDETTGDLTFVDVPDHDDPADSNRDSVYNVTLNATDGTHDRGFDVIVTVTNVDEPPVITGPGSVEIEENATRTLGTYSATDPEGGTVIVTLAGVDATHFTFSGGALAFAAPPDFEDRASYSLTIEAADAAHTARLAVTVNVSNVDEAGTLELSSGQPQVGTRLEATLADSDGSISAESWTWERGAGATWTPISGANSRFYTPVDDDVGSSLRVTVDYTDGHGSGKRVLKVSARSVQAPPPVNNAPEFDSPSMDRSVDENAPERTLVGAWVRATDADNDVLTYTLSGPDAAEFTIDGSSGQIRVGPGTVLDRETEDTYTVIVTATDPSDEGDSTTVTITVNDIDEPPVARDDRLTTPEDTPVTIDVLRNDSDPEGVSLMVALARANPAQGTPTLETDNTFRYTPNPNEHGVHSFTYTASDGVNAPVGATVYVTVRSVNDPPRFEEQPTEREIGETAREGDPVGAPFTATDVDHEPLTLSYSLSGAGADAFEIEEHTGQIMVATDAVLDAAVQAEYMLTVTARDPDGASATLEITITVSESAVTVPTPSFGGGGFPAGLGGGGPSGPEPSELDFEWTVDRDIEELDEGNDRATGMWSDGTTLWLLDNADGAGDAAYAYDLATGERVEEREFALDETNRAPRGNWSDGQGVAWVSDSGQDKLFAYDLDSGERVEERDIALTRRNRDARGIWSDGVTMWVLDGGKNALFAYELGSGEFIAEYALHDANGDPRGIWSDDTTVWVSDHGAKRLFAYRLPAPPEDGPPEEPPALERVSAEEFGEPGRVGNNSPRGIWSDGAVMYVADANDDKVYSYNMPDAIDARLASLTLEGIDIGTFDPARREYEGVAGDGVSETTVTAEAAQDGATVGVAPADADAEAEGHQVALAGLDEITVTVTSADGSRERVYGVRFAEAVEAGSSPSCLRGAIAVGFSLVVSEGGSVDDLVACAERRDVTALYVLHEGEWVSHILGAPDFVNAPFRALFADSVPALLPLVLRSEGAATPAPAAPEVTEPFATCLRGEVAQGFSLVLYEGGSVDELASCAEAFGISAIYTLADGQWVSYILAAPDFVNARFRELFQDGVPIAAPLVVRSEAR